MQTGLRSVIVFSINFRNVSESQNISLTNSKKRRLKKYFFHTWICVKTIQWFVFKYWAMHTYNMIHILKICYTHLNHNNRGTVVCDQDQHDNNNIIYMYFIQCEDVMLNAKNDKL